MSGLLYVVGAYGLAQSVGDEEEISEKMTGEAKWVRSLAAWIFNVLLFLVGVSIYISIVQTISEAVHPEFYSGL